MFGFAGARPDARLRGRGRCRVPHAEKIGALTQKPNEKFSQSQRPVRTIHRLEAYATLTVKSWSIIAGQSVPRRVTFRREF
jgi:hypothetical protein